MNYSDETQVKRKNNQIRIDNIEENLKMLGSFIVLDGSKKDSPSLQLVALLSKQIKTLKFNL